MSAPITNIRVAQNLVSGDPSPVDVFGPYGADGAPTGESRRVQRQLAKLLHPDAGNDTEAEFAALMRLWDDYRDRTHGAIVVNGKRRRIDSAPIRGDIANVYRLVDSSGLSTEVMKVARSVQDNDLIRSESVALQQLADRGDDRFSAYVPPPGTRVRMRSTDGSERLGTVFPRLEGFMTLAEIGELWPYGVDPRDAAWMWRRLLVAVGYAHKAGIVHAAVLPEHIMIHPGEHGLVLVDWCYAVSTGAKAVAIVDRHADRYPRDVTERRGLDPGIDITMATRCMTDLIGPRLPTPMRDFARGCVSEQATRRPQDAWSLLAEFDELLHELWGPRVFRTFNPFDPQRFTTTR